MLLIDHNHGGTMNPKYQMRIKKIETLLVDLLLINSKSNDNFIKLKVLSKYKRKNKLNFQSNKINSSLELNLLRQYM